MPTIDNERAKLLIEEFKEAGHLHRLHLGLMFGQITVFLGASGALLHRVVGLPVLDQGAARLLAVTGLFLAVLFLVLHERVYAYSAGARARAEEIQRDLELDLYKPRNTEFKPVQGIRAATITRTLYLASATLWIVLLAAPNLVLPSTGAPTVTLPGGLAPSPK